MSPQAPLIALVDSRHDGHHPMYAALYARVLRELGCDVWLVAPPGMIAAMPSAEPRSAAAGSLSIRPWEPPARPAPGTARVEVHVARLWESLGAEIDRAAAAEGRYPTLVLHLYFDDFISEVSTARAVEERIHCPFAGLWFKPPPRWPPNTRESLKRLLRVGRRYPSLRAAPCAGVLVFDAGATRHLSRRGRPPFFEVPEVSNAVLPPKEPELVAEIRRQAAGRSVYSMVGSIDGRKGLRDFLQAAEAAPVGEWFFVMAGCLIKNDVDERSSRMFERLSAGPAPRLMLVDEWLDDETLNAIVAGSSLLHVCYKDWPYSSNMICKSAVHRVPAIGRKKGYIGGMIRRYDLGIVLPPDGSLAARFVPGFAAEVADFTRSEAFLGGCSRYLAANNPDVLGDTLVHLLEKCRPSIAVPARGRSPHAD